MRAEKTFEIIEGKAISKLLKENNLCVLCGEVFDNMNMINKEV